MTCSECLEAMLDAEPADLPGHGDGALAEHLGGCLSCRRAAAAIAADTRVLAGVARYRTKARRASRRVAIGGLAAAGTIIAFTLRTIGHDAAPRAVTRPVAQPAPPVATLRFDSSSTASPSPLASRSEGEGAGSIGTAPAGLQRIQAVAIQPAAFTAVPLPAANPGDAADETPMVSVRPQGGRRAAVFRVADANVTVVWLY